MQMHEAIKQLQDFCPGAFIRVGVYHETFTTDNPDEVRTGCTWMVSVRDNVRLMYVEEQGDRLPAIVMRLRKKIREHERDMAKRVSTD